MELSVRVDNISFSYNPRRQILKNISVSVPKGKIIAIMGGSGSGKTTLLRNICGQSRPVSGEIWTLGKRVNDMKDRELFELRKKIGMMFQFGGLFTDMSVFENVAFPIREHTDMLDESIRDLVLLKLQAVGLRGSINLSPSELSGGMARRVALARAVAVDPQLILYDEPFAGLDPISLTITARLIRELNDALGASSVIVTHDVAESFRIVDYVYLMWNGEIVAEGEPDQLQKSTLPYVSQFVNAEIDGPLPFHQPAPLLSSDLGLSMPKSGMK